MHWDKFSSMIRRALLALMLLAAINPMAARANPDSDTSFAFALYREVAKTPGNLVISPFSLSTTLTMLYAGAAGSTATQMARVLHLTPNPHAPLGLLLQQLNSPNPAYKIQVANRIWPSLNLKLQAGFTQSLSQHYQAGLESVDYRQTEKARQRINQWVAEQTHGKIPQLLNPSALDSKTLLVLTNAIFFQGQWLHPFPTSATAEGSFHKRNGTRVSCPMMRLSGTFNYARLDSASLLELPYQGDRLAMILILPPPQQNLEDWEKLLDEAVWQQWMQALHSEPVAVTLPRFKISTDLSMKDTLQAVGLRCLFEHCDLSAAFGEGGSAAVSDCIHQAVIEVQEEGTVAAAATAVVVSRSVPRAFEVNRPCLFAVRDQVSGSLLFLGRLENPAAVDNP